jgi:hypothetical protein
MVKCIRLTRSFYFDSVSGHVHLYNVDRVSTWLTKHPRNAALVPPKRTYIHLSYPRTCGSASTVHFWTRKPSLLALERLSTAGNYKKT